MRAIAGDVILIGLASFLSSCAMPYYAAPPAAVYYPLHGAAIYYPDQRASIYYPASRSTIYTGREETRSSAARRAHHPTAEQSQAAEKVERAQGTKNDSGWIDPEP
jgi:hypothetical protein